MRRLCLGVLVLSAVVVQAATAPAFEGTLKWRLVQVGKEPLAKIAGEGASADKVFAVPIDTLMSPQSGAVVSEAVVHVKGSMVRADSASRDGQGYFVMDLDEGVTQVVMPGEKKVMVVDKEDVHAMEQRMKSYRAMFMKQLENAPPEQRSQLEAAIKAQDAPPPTFDIVPLGKTETISGMETSAYEVKGGAVPTVGWLTKEKADVLDLFRKLESNRAKLNPRAAGSSPKDALTREGLPVRVQTLTDRGYMVEDLIAVEEKPISADLFVVPASYQKSSARAVMEKAGTPGGAGGETAQAKPAAQKVAPKKPTPKKATPKPAAKPKHP